MKVYLDMCCFSRPFDDQTQLRIWLETQAKLFIQGQIAGGGYDLVWSYMLSYENSRNRRDDCRRQIQSWKQRASEVIEESEGLLVRAEEIEGDGIGANDAVHIACAEISACDYFLTTDRRLLGYKKANVRIVDPIRFIQDMEV